MGLLRYLGQKDLLERGDDGWPWDHPSNRIWMQNIPATFRSDERNDGRTTLVLMTGADTAYATDTAPRPEDFSDCAGEHDPGRGSGRRLCRPVDRAQDYEFKPDTVQAALFGRHKDCCYALFGGKTGVRRIPADIADGDLLALITPGGGKTAASLAATRPPTVELDERLIRELGQQPLVRFAGGDAVGQNDPASVAAGDVTAPAPAGPKDVGAGSEDAERPVPPSPANGGAAMVSRRPVPDASARERARQTLREIYRDEYAKARTADEKRELADKLLARARTLDADPVGRYMALELGRKIATEAGAIPLALDAADLMQSDFEADVLRDKGQVLAASVGLRLSESDDERVLREARSLIDGALRQEEFDLAERIQAAGLSAARRLKDLEATAEFADRRKEIVWARAARTVAMQCLETLAVAPRDAEACHSVGVYYCLVKQRWEDGLVMLAQPRRAFCRIGRAGTQTAGGPCRAGRAGGRLVAVGRVGERPLAERRDAFASGLLVRASLAGLAAGDRAGQGRDARPAGGIRDGTQVDKRFDDSQSGTIRPGGLSERKRARGGWESLLDAA